MCIRDRNIEVVNSESFVVHSYELHSVVGHVFTLVNINLCYNEKDKIHVYM